MNRALITTTKTPSHLPLFKFVKFANGKVSYGPVILALMVLLSRRNSPLAGPNLKLCEGKFTVPKCSGSFEIFRE